MEEDLSGGRNPVRREVEAVAILSQGKPDFSCGSNTWFEKGEPAMRFGVAHRRAVGDESDDHQMRAANDDTFRD
jgi:hypothetical protein